MNQNIVPRFVSSVSIILGCMDLARGFMHTVVLPFSATQIACLDLSGPSASDLLRLLGLFGISNFITGATLILAGLYARPVALALLGLIPAFYGLGLVTIHQAMSTYPPSTAQWRGRPLMMVILPIYLLTFLAAVTLMVRNRSRIPAPSSST